MMSPASAQQTVIPRMNTLLMNKDMVYMVIPTFRHWYIPAYAMGRPAVPVPIAGNKNLPAAGA